MSNIKFSELVVSISVEKKSEENFNFCSLHATRIYSTPFVFHAENKTDIKNLLLDFFKSCSNHVTTDNQNTDMNKQLSETLKLFTKIIETKKLSMVDIVSTNKEKILSRKKPENFDLQNQDHLDFDKDYDPDEKIPYQFSIKFYKRNQKTYMKWNDVKIGSPLSDNIEVKDGYQYHDVFHIAYAAILHWSPVFRALIRHKRKSSPEVDETQDGGRAIVIEEGLTAWLFSKSKDFNYFKDSQTVSYDILKTIQQFIKGYEVDKCPLFLWEQAILDGYKVFNQLKEKGTGEIHACRKTRSIKFIEMD